MIKKRRRLKPKIKLIMLCIITIILIITTIIIPKKYSFKKMTEFVAYDAKGTFDYSICYKENDYVSDKCFSDDNRGYVNALIDNIAINYKYILRTSQNAEQFKYTYKITAQTIATEKSDSNRILYSEIDTLYEESNEINDTSIVMIDKKINVDFQKYNEIITNFKKNYILSMDSSLILTATLDVTGIHSHLKDDVKNHRVSQIIVPLSEQTVDVETNNTSFSQNDTVAKYSNVPIYSKPIIVSTIVYILDIIVIGEWIYMLIIYNQYNHSFDKKIDKILKQYDRAIVKVENIPDLTDLKIINVSSFEELLDVRDNLNKPILYKGKNLSAQFVIINGAEAYIYELEAYYQNGKQ